MYVALACAVLVLACAGSSPSSAVRGFYEAAAAGKTDSAIDLLSERTVNTLGRGKLQAGIQELARKAQQQGGMKELKITKEQVSGDVADVSFTISYGNGIVETNSEHLVKEKGRWRLQPKKLTERISQFSPEPR
jgi:hypothetical protein